MFINFPRAFPIAKKRIKRLIIKRGTKAFLPRARPLIMTLKVDCNQATTT